MINPDTEYQNFLNQSALQNQDPEVFDLIQKETQRQQNKLSMIPSENFFSKAVREATGSILAHKYAEGNIGKRYYEGNKYIDAIERLTKDYEALDLNLNGEHENKKKNKNRLITPVKIRK